VKDTLDVQAEPPAAGVPGPGPAAARAVGPAANPALASAATTTIGNRKRYILSPSSR
jgi:hypothetical protein